MTLEEKFKAFVLSMRDSECIDQLPDPGKGRRKADYLLRERGFIVEVKYLTEDRGKTVSQKLSDLANSDPEFPQFFGSVHVEEIIRAHPDADNFRSWICNYAARTLDSLIRSANHQISDTRIALQLNRGAGILVLLNEGVQLYDDDFVFQEVSRILGKKDKDGNLERPQVEAVWFINEYHAKEKQVSSSAFIGPAARNDQLNVLMDMLQVHWASYNGYLLHRPRHSKGKTT